MITISLELSNDLVQRVMPFQDRLEEIIELGLREMELSRERKASYPRDKQQVLDALASTGIVTLPRPGARRKASARRTPILAGGPPARQAVTSYKAFLKRTPTYTRRSCAPASAHGNAQIIPNPATPRPKSLATLPAPQPPCAP